MIRTLRRNSKCVRILLSVASIFLIEACTLKADQIELDRAREAQAKKNNKAALRHYLRLRDITKNKDLKMQATQEAAKICYYDLKDYAQALEHFKTIVSDSPDVNVRYQAQKMIAEINFSHLQNYEAAVVELNHLLDLKPEEADRDRARLALSKAYFYRTNYFQSRVEAETLMKTSKDQQYGFEAMRMIASSFQEEKKLDEAAQVFIETVKKYPEESKKESLGLNLAVIYEEQKNFKKAIEILTQVRELYPDPKFIDRRIASLKSRAMQLPGARGLKK